MSMTLLGWILIASSIAMSALVIVPLGPRRAYRDAFDLEAWLSLSGWRVEQAFQSAARTLMVTLAVFLFVAGVGAATTYVSVPPAETPSADTDDQLVGRLDDYVRSLGPETPAPKAAEGSDLLPDVSTMIERLAARLESAPDDVKGWRMLGWSYFNMGLYQQAAAAYAKAVALEPGSDEIARAYKEAKAKAESGNADTVSSSPSEASSATNENGSFQSGEATPHETDTSIRLMVDSLAGRLEASPRDVDGWVRLMRSRVVLGEAEAAATAFRKALDIFKDDSMASTTIAAAAIELGLETNK